MRAHVSFITLAVPDLVAIRQFYLDRLGWEAQFIGDDVVMIRVGDALMLSFWSESGFEAEVGPLRRGDGLAPLTLAYNVASPDEVNTVLAQARAAGAEVHDGVERIWGGFSGYFADPAGFRWEVAYNPDPSMSFTTVT